MYKNKDIAHGSIFGPDCCPEYKPNPQIIDIKYIYNV